MTNITMYVQAAWPKVHMYIQSYNSVSIRTVEKQLVSSVMDEWKAFSVYNVIQLSIRSFYPLL